MLGAIGEDGIWLRAARALNRAVFRLSYLFAPETSTFTYTKLINATSGVEDQPRVDFINTRPLPETVERKIVARLRDSAGNFDVIFVSDQAETEHGGVITPAVREVLAQIAPGKIVLADSRPAGRGVP